MGNNTSNSDDAIDADEIVHPALQRIGARKPDTICCLTCQEIGNPLDQHHFDTQNVQPRKQESLSAPRCNPTIKQTRFHPSANSPGAAADSFAPDTPVRHTAQIGRSLEPQGSQRRTPLSPAVFYYGPAAPGWTAEEQEQLQWSVETAAGACSVPPPSYLAMQAPRPTAPFA